MIKIPHLYRVEAGPLGPAKRPAAPNPATEEPWRAVDGKPHLEQNDRGQFRTKDFMSESNNPYPSVPDKSKTEPMKPYFDLGVEDYGCWEDPTNSVMSVIREKLPRVLSLDHLDPYILRDALTEVRVGLSKFWSAPMLRSGEERTRAINFGLDVAKSACLRYWGKCALAINFGHEPLHDYRR